MSSTYTYSLTRDFGGSVDVPRLSAAIAASSAITPNVTSVTIIGDVVHITFQTALSTDGQTALNAIIAAHMSISFNRYTLHFTMWSLFEEYSTGSNAGTANTGWQTRTLNASRGSNRPYVSLHNNEFTLTRGTYTLFASAPGYRVRNHRVRIYNVTTNRVELNGDSHFSNNSQTIATVSGFLIVTRVPQTYRLDHYCQTRRNNSGLGVAVGVAGANEQYAHVRLQRLY